MSGGQTYTAVTSSQTGPDVRTPGVNGCKLILNMTSAGTGSISVSVQGKDKQSGVYYTILTGAAIVANGTTVYTIFPGAPAVANVSANDAIPEVWRWLVTANNANPTSYSVGFST